MKKVAMSRDNSRPKVMEAIKASLKSFCRIGLQDSDCIDCAINSIGIEELIVQAEAGDKDAEKRLRTLAAFCLSDDDFEPLRAYAERVFERLNKGLPDPHRPAGGSPPHPYRQKLWIAHWIYKARQAGKTQNQACSAFVEFIGKTNREGEDVLSTEQARRIYVDAKQDIETLYTEIQKAKAATIPMRCVD